MGKAVIVCLWRVYGFSLVNHNSIKQVINGACPCVPFRACQAVVFGGGVRLRLVVVVGEIGRQNFNRGEHPDQIRR